MGKTVEWRRSFVVFFVSTINELVCGVCKCVLNHDDDTENTWNDFQIQLQWKFIFYFWSKTKQSKAKQSTSHHAYIFVVYRFSLPLLPHTLRFMVIFSVIWVFSLLFSSLNTSFPTIPIIKCKHICCIRVCACKCAGVSTYEIEVRAHTIHSHFH